MKLLTALAFASILSNTAPTMPMSLRTSFSALLSRIHAERVLPALDYYFFSA